jgi:hypothetical protein
MADPFPGKILPGNEILTHLPGCFLSGKFLSMVFIEHRIENLSFLFRCS